MQLSLRCLFFCRYRAVSAARIFLTNGFVLCCIRPLFAAEELLMKTNSTLHSFNNTRNINSAFLPSGPDRATQARRAPVYKRLPTLDYLCRREISCLNGSFIVLSDAEGRLENAVKQASFGMHTAGHTRRLTRSGGLTDQTATGKTPTPALSMRYFSFVTSQA